MRPILAPAPVARLDRDEPPTFSAIIAAYQAAEFVGDAIESLLAQTLAPVEIIVVDDGSTDDLEGALAPYRDRIVLLRKENGGEASAKNMGARAAAGELIAILDADDVYYPERLEALAELCVRRPDLDIVTTDCRVVDGPLVWNSYSESYRFETGDQRRGILERNFVGPGHMAVRREPFLTVGGFDESFRWATDWDCWIRMIFAGSRVGMVDRQLAEYRIRETGLAFNRPRLLEARVTVLEKASARPDLSSDERAVLERSLSLQRRLHAVAIVQDALVQRSPEARALALSLARKTELPPSSRLRAAAAVALPGLAGRLLAARRRARRQLVGGVRA